MNTNLFQLYKCWEDERIDKVINKDAVAIERGEFLATHTPFNQIRYLRSPRQAKSGSENEFLLELVHRSVENRHTFAVVQGIPGTGKSHLIRWLKERYLYANTSDVVLLIQRDNSTLKGTLRQIIREGVFQDEQMKEHLKRLQGAFDRLSDDTLADELVDNFRTGTQNPQTLPPSKIGNRVYNFLMDINIRNWLKRPGGPIERITKHLTKADEKSGLQADEHPGFLEDDFLVDANTRSRLYEAYRQVQDFVAELEENPNLRHDLMVYLNSLVDFAINRSVMLSGDDLKMIFFDLRRNLKAQGRDLALFIEDITAFTGINAGLVDVLVTQHTGEGNREFCRMLSVIGITNSFYQDHFPDNLKDRIDILLTLNSSDDQTAESALLKEGDALAGMVARYMNAIRMSEQDVNDWSNFQEADMSRLPVRCQSCDFQQTCFLAFGSVVVRNSEESDGVAIGLYPFNRQSIMSMYSGLDETVAKTPRALLNSIVARVLGVHGPKIADREFPPASRDLGGEFITPQLTRPEQLSVIERQGGQDALRLETLVRVWGNRTIDSTEKDGKRFVGGLSEEAFLAFGIQFIPGVNRSVGIPQTPLSPTPVKPVVNPEGTPQTGTIQPPLVQPEPEIIQSPPRITNKPEFDRYQRDIMDWYGGSKLNHYDRYAQWLSGFLVNWINWPLHEISEFYAEKKLSYGRIFFEGQIGPASTSQIRFPRTAQMRDFLIALTRINTLADGILLGKLEPSVLGSVMGIFSRWLRLFEPKVVEFVRSIKEGVSAEKSIEEISIQNNLLLNALGGYYDLDLIDDFNVYYNMVSVAKNRPDWTKVRDPQNTRHLWAQLRNNPDLDPNIVDRSRTTFLSLFNLPQGRGNIIFLDAPKILRYVRTFQWTWPEKDRKSIEGADDPWKGEMQIEATILPSFQSALADLKRIVDADHQEVTKLLGGQTPEKVFTAFHEVHQSYRSAGKVFRMDENPDLSAGQLTKLLITIKSLLSESRQDRVALRVSIDYVASHSLLIYRTYLQQMYDELVKHEQELDRLLTAAPSGLNTTEVERVKGLYRDIDQALDDLIDNLEKGKTK